MFSVFALIVVISFATITVGNPIKCKDGQFLDENSNCLVCHFLCSKCTSFGINVIENGCHCNSNVYKNETSIYCALECPSPEQLSPASECIKASEFNFQNATDGFSPLQTASDVSWLFLIAAILACCCFCCAG